MNAADAPAAGRGEPLVAVCCLSVTFERSDDRSGDPATARVRVEFQPDVGRRRRRTVNVVGAAAALDVVERWLTTLGDPGAVTHR